MKVAETYVARGKGQAEDCTALNVRRRVHCLWFHLIARYLQELHAVERPRPEETAWGAAGICTVTVHISATPYDCILLPGVWQSSDPFAFLVSARDKVQCQQRAPNDNSAGALSELHVRYL